MRTVLPALLLLLSPAQAQIDPGFLTAIVQDGARVGELLVVPIDGMCEYREYWYLYPSYQVPTGRNRLDLTVMELVPTTPAPAGMDPTRFLEEAERAFPGGTTIVSTAVEYRPGCR
jgi:hypothetical protein